MTMPDSKKRLMHGEADDAYLWDRSGSPRKDVVALEQALAPLRWHASSLRAPSEVARAPRARMVIHRATHWRAAAGIAIAVLLTWLAATTIVPRNVRTGMEVMTVAGSPTVAGAEIETAMRLATGQWLETDAQSAAQIVVGSIGRVDVEPRSRVRMVRSGANEHRLELERGSMRALISAPPRLFVVDTPAATAFDLGCAYRMHVDEHGHGEIEVTLGWVSFESDRGVSIVPHGAACLARRGLGTGTPYYIDADARLIEALERFDFQRGGREALTGVLDAATIRDSLTLWHLLTRTRDADRVRVFERLVSFVPLPEGVAPNAVLAGDPTALREWRNAMAWSPAIMDL